MGEVTTGDVTMAKGLVLMQEMMKTDDMIDLEWQDACLVTPQHSVR